MEIYSKPNELKMKMSKNSRQNVEKARLSDTLFFIFLSTFLNEIKHESKK